MFPNEISPSRSILVTSTNSFVGSKMKAYRVLPFLFLFFSFLFWFLSLRRPELIFMDYFYSGGDKWDNFSRFLIIRESICRIIVWLCSISRSAILIHAYNIFLVSFVELQQGIEGNVKIRSIFRNRSINYHLSYYSKYIFSKIQIFLII